MLDSKSAKQAELKTDKKDQDPASKGVTTPESDKKGNEKPEAMAAKLFTGNLMDWSQISATLSSNAKVCKVVAENPEYLNKIIDCEDAAAKPAINTSLDHLVDHINDQATMVKVFTKRFGVNVADGAVQQGIRETWNLTCKDKRYTSYNTEYDPTQGGNDTTFF